MAALKRLVLLVEGDGDVDAVPVLVRHLLNEIDPPPGIACTWTRTPCGWAECLV